ncbi:MAG: putative enzyme related to lactoylglutathione lyase, partial [Gammaproteobacteria bacterium]
DAQAAKNYYASAFGWQFQEAPELGGALVASLPGGSLCGIREPMHAAEKPLVRTYLRVADIRAAVADAKRLGAEVMLEHMEIPGRGQIAIFGIGGIEQGVWQVSEESAGGGA